MTEQNRDINFHNGQRAVGKKRNKSKRQIPRKAAIILMALILIAAVIVIIISVKSGNQSKDLIGIWRYDEHTQYYFEEDGTGKLIADGVTYTYDYSVENKTLSLDFTDDIVLECEYTFSIEGTTLTLVGGIGTDGGTYRLNKE